MSPQALVIRDGMEHGLSACEIVPGDILVLARGAKVAADARLIQLSDLCVDESILTGESLPVAKSLEDHNARVFAGTLVTSGRAEALVTAIVQNTEFGRIADLTSSIGTKTTNLRSKLGQLACQLGIAAPLVAACVTLLGIVLGLEPVEMVMTGLSLSVAMVPEGLPAVVTVTLARGATAMVRKKAARPVGPCA